MLQYVVSSPGGGGGSSYSGGSSSSYSPSYSSGSSGSSSYHYSSGTSINLSGNLVWVVFLIIFVVGLMIGIVIWTNICYRKGTCCYKGMAGAGTSVTVTRQQQATRTVNANPIVIPVKPTPIMVDYNAGYGYNQEPMVDLVLVNSNNYQAWGLNSNDKCSWTGFLRQGGVGKINMHFDDFQINFDGLIWGSGKDEVGKFGINGKMNLRTGAFKFIKQYVGQHAVSYTGNQTQGVLTGRWEIPGNASGDFQIKNDAPWWSGCFWQNGQRTDMHLEMNVAKKSVFGIGYDMIGSFLIRGAVMGSDVQFAKQYFGQHTVIYNGRRNGDVIQGLWQIPGNCDGKFQLHMAYKF